eukprot:snap_masked-scaffold_9-processed-gene-11.21-mRNA-1 protein AED:0.33 eAED:1.00 QI:0/-1/0/1/-1/1/1/0/142
MSVFLYSKNKFKKVLDGASAEALSFQAVLLNEVFIKLCAGFSISQIFAIGFVISLFFLGDLTEYIFAVPSEGKINFLFTMAQISRSFVALFSVYSLLTYLNAFNRESSMVRTSKNAKVSTIKKPTIDISRSTRVRQSYDFEV